MTTPPWRRKAVTLAALTSLAPAICQAQTFRPPNLRPDIASPEAGLWGASDKAEAYVKGSAELDSDPALTAYVRGVVCKIAAEYCPELRVYILDRPVLNAAAAPNGYIEVNSGLLLRARTEDELAYVLGHEVSHFARNHSLERWSHLKSTANAVLALQVVVTVGATAAMYSAAASGSTTAGSSIDSISRAAQSLNNLIYLQGIASVFAFSREEESEADALGYRHLADARYQTGAAAAIWRAVVAETAASDFPSVRKSESRASIFNTHPITADRITALSKLANDAPGDPDPQALKRYRAAIRPHLGAWLKDDLRRKDFGETLYLIGRMEQTQEDLGLLNYYRGEAYRLRRGDGDLGRALEAYQSASTHPDAPSATWRELGEGLRRNGDRAGAATAFETYLQKAPDAQDRWIVEATLKNLKTPEAQ